MILNAAGRATEMVSRIQAGTGASGEAPPAFLDLNTVVESCAMASRPKWKNQAESEGRKIELDLDLRAQNRVYGRPSEVDEVLTNLIFNAVDAMPEGGRISIRTWDEDGRIFLSAEDTGVGMPPDVLRRLGELFFTTKGDRGHGLGMAFCYRVVEQMGGRIEVDSTVGEGSRFLIRFPGKDEDQKQNQMDSGRSLRGRQVLVVEDDEYVQNLLRLALPDCDVSVASEGEAGLGLLKEGCFDVALVDFSMPRLNGADVAREIQQIAPNLPIVLMTGWAELPVDVEGLFRGFLTKPFTVQRLKECLSDVLAE